MINYNKIKKIHFIGIGGSGMSGIAEVLHNAGFIISGSDIAENENVRHLKAIKIPVYIGHRTENIASAEAVVFSSAIEAANPEICAAREQKLPIISRAEMLAELMRLKFGIAIAGTHGKTTTTSMVAYILQQQGLDPTFVVGGIVRGAESGARLGSSDYLVAEADESDGSFLNLNPIINVINNIENDHLEFYKTMHNLRQAFLKFANHLPFYGATIVNIDCPNVRKIIGQIRRRTITFGLKEGDFQARISNASFNQTEYQIFYKADSVCKTKLNIGGQHNVLNSLAAIAVCSELGIAVPDAAAALIDFKLPQRRLQVILEKSEITYIDDYAHHPSEIAAVLKTVRQGDFKRIITIFQPHRYTRLKILAAHFARVLKKSDLLILAPIYSANQDPIPGVDSSLLAELIKKDGATKVYTPRTFDQIKPILLGEAKPKDAVLFLSAGNLSRWAHNFVAELKNER